jgi:hypothetical protein
MLPRRETRWIVVTATMTPERIPVREIEYRARKYGYLDSGCHFVIEDTSHTLCRPDHLIGVGAKPHNDSSVIVMLSGEPPFTQAQLDDLASIVEAMAVKYPQADVVAHSDLPGSRTKAPGFDVRAWWTGMRAVNALRGSAWGG